MPDWVPDDLPERFELTDAETYGPPTTPGDSPAEPTHRVRWVIVQFDGDRVVATIDLTRGVSSPDRYAQPAYSEVSDDRVLDSVRGQPGRISRWINRGDPVGEQVAQWTEDGDRWLATSSLGVDELGRRSSRSRCAEPSSAIRPAGSRSSAGTRATRRTRSWFRG